MKSCIFNQTGPPRRVDAWPRYGSVYVMCRYQGHNDILPSSRTKIRVDNLAFANLCSYPLSCTAATVEILGLSVFLRDTTARHAHIVGIKLATLRQLFGALTGWATQPCQADERVTIRKRKINRLFLQMSCWLPVNVLKKLAEFY